MINDKKMKSLIIYKSKHGTTEKVANYIKDHMPGETSLLHLDKYTQKVSLKDYDTVIIGGSIYMGKIQDRIKAFCKEHEEELLKKHLGLFICYMNEENGKKP